MEATGVEPVIFPWLLARGCVSPNTLPPIGYKDTNFFNNKPKYSSIIQILYPEGYKWRQRESNPTQIACKAFSPPWYMCPQRKSERQESNLRFHGPKPCDLPD